MRRCSSVLTTEVILDHIAPPLISIVKDKSKKSQMLFLDNFTFFNLICRFLITTRSSAAGAVFNQPLLGLSH